MGRSTPPPLSTPEDKLGKDRLALQTQNNLHKASLSPRRSRHHFCQEFEAQTSHGTLRRGYSQPRCSCGVLPFPPSFEPPFSISAAASPARCDISVAYGPGRRGRSRCYLFTLPESFNADELIRARAPTPTRSGSSTEQWLLLFALDLPSLFSFQDSRRRFTLFG